MSLSPALFTVAGMRAMSALARHYSVLVGYYDCIRMRQSTYAPVCTAPPFSRLTSMMELLTRGTAQSSAWLP